MLAAFVSIALWIAAIGIAAPSLSPNDLGAMLTLLFFSYVAGRFA